MGIRRPAATLALATLAVACGPTDVPAARDRVTPTPSTTPPIAASPSTTTQTTPPTTTPTCTTTQALARWSLVRRAAQLVVVPVHDFDIAGAQADIAAGAGGVLFLGTASPPADLRSRLVALRAAAAHGIAPFVMADEEGGGVQRLAGAVSSMPWPRDMARTMSPSSIRALATHVGSQMRGLGVTVDLAPVVDVDDRPGPSSSNPDGARSFSGQASVVSTDGVAFMSGLRGVGELAVLKHFPGLGGSSANTDNGVASTVPIASLRTSGLVPFRAAIRAGAPAVMVSNASVPGLTSLPSSLSDRVIRGLLRDELGFRGLVVTDSLSAAAVQSTTSSLPAAAVRAIGAGADVVLFGSTLTAADTDRLAPANVLADFHAIVGALVTAVRSGTLPVAALNAAVTQVLVAKHIDLCG